MAVKKVYVAGPMTGIPQFNIPAFITLTARLRRAGYEVVSPVERDSDAVREAALASLDGKLVNDMIAGETWGEILARDVAIVADEVQAIVVLPGWEHSRGARLEVFTALLCRKSVYFDDNANFVGLWPRLELIPLSDIVLKLAMSFYA